MVESLPNVRFPAKNPLAESLQNLMISRSVLSYVRSQSKIALAVASSGIAALLLRGGQTAHSRFGIPVEKLNATSTCNMPVKSEEADVIRQANLIIWDEAPMAHRHAVEAVDRLLCDIMRTHNPEWQHIPFVGEVILFGGNLRQTLHVIPHGSRAQIVNACIKRSYIWQHVQVFKLTFNMRIRQAPGDLARPAVNDQQQFAKYLLRVGNGTEPVVNAADDDIMLPEGWSHTASTLDDVINATWPELARQAHQDPQAFIEANILTPLNRNVDIINQRATELFPGDAYEYKGHDDVADTSQAELYPPEYLNCIEEYGLQPFCLRLKKG